ncbi:KAP family P-loop NTPase fold protein [Microlunatus ginsengisoli]|uniref:KAP NTPase domain-containing protein n=1 Tax=Microlunatus ginsengisoli TaxID=363863 RepID=A0ABP6ZX76_9ACTN
MSSEPSSRSSSATAAPPNDPVTDVLTSAGLTVDPRVGDCVLLAAAAHRQRFETKSADGPALNRSTFLWALWWLDGTVRAALDDHGGRIEDFEKLLGVTGNPGPAPDHIELGGELTRALRAFVADPSTPAGVVTPGLLGVAILRDVEVNGGLLADRLRDLRIDAARALDTLRILSVDQSEPAAVIGQVPLPRMWDVTPRRFGVHLPADADEPGPYVARDADVELDRSLSEQVPVVAVVAPPMSGAIRAVFEALRRRRPDDRVLLLHELLDSGPGHPPLDAADLDRLWGSGAGVVWVRDLRELLDASPVFEDWFRRRGGGLRATLVAVLRPEDTGRASDLGLLSGALVELTGGLSTDEQVRAQKLYGAELATVSAVAAASARRPAVVRANYAADSATAAELLDEDGDDLDIHSDVEVLAKLIASKDVQPPLSIGLFGPWGSGKSFLMRQVQLRIEDLGTQSRAVADPSATGYHREIVPVEFNAWQYAHGTALWAALINRVFQQIQQKLGGDQRYQTVLREIAVRDAGVAQAHARLDLARAKVDQSRPAAQDRVIEDVARDHHLADDAIEKLAAGLQLDAATKQVSDLKSEYDRLITTSSRLDKGWATASTPRRLMAGGLLAVGVAAAVVCALLPGAVEQLGALVGAFASIALALVQLLRPVNRGLEQAAKILRADEADKQELQRAQDDLDQATQDLAAAKASGLAGLYGFVSDRSSSADYRRELGMAPMIRDDLERLARLSKVEGGLPGIDRIVIFIDDLDRCPAAEVVRVLEAVNLLFGFELFVVVIAVDSRWLLRSLEGTFSDAFDPDDSAAPTPQNYLEKIIQIPFWLQPMQPDGFGRLVTSLAGEVDSSRRDLDAVHANGNGSNSFAGVPAADGYPFHDGEPATHEVAGADASDDASVPSRPGVGVRDAQSGPTHRDDLNPKALRLTQDELDLMVRFHPLVGTPRAVKRFLNTYQLLRVSVPDVDSFLDRKDFRPVLILLALLTGTVPVSDPMILELRSMTDANFADFLDSTQTGRESSPRRDLSADWKPVVSACADLPTASVTPEIIATWLPKVGRYSFHPVST